MTEGPPGRVLRESVSEKPNLIPTKAFAVTSLDEAETVIITFAETKLIASNADPLEKPLSETLKKNIDQGYRHFILNFQNVAIIDSSGVGLVIVANRIVSLHDAKLYLCGMRPCISHVLDLMSISKYLSIFDTEEEALAEVREAAKR